MSKHSIHILSYFSFAILAATTLPGCDTSVKTDDAQVGDAVVKQSETKPANVLVVDTAKSQLTWIGAKMTGRHNGLFKIESGELHMSNGELHGGVIELDMTGMRSDDKTIDQESNAKLTKHLRSEDFFDVDKYKTAKFELTGIVPYDSAKTPTTAPFETTDSQLRIQDPTHRVTGNLTIKGQTKSVTFPAKITIEDNQLKAKANFNIDRTHWGLVYRSDKSLGNQTIRPEVNIGFYIIAKPQPE